MSKSNALWMHEVECVGLDYEDGTLTLKQAVDQLVRLGHDADEAETMLTELYVPVTTHLIQAQ